MAVISKLFVSAVCFASLATASVIHRSLHQPEPQPEEPCPEPTTAPAPGYPYTPEPAPAPGHPTPPGSDTPGYPAAPEPAPAPGHPAPPGSDNPGHPGAPQPAPVPGNPSTPSPAPAPGHPTPPGTDAPGTEPGEGGSIEEGLRPGQGRKLATGYWDVFPERPDVAHPKTNGVHLEGYASVSQRETVIVFEGIPVGAINCSIGFISEAPDDRVFIAKVTPSGTFPTDMLSNVTQLSGFPEEGTPVSYNTVTDFDVIEGRNGVKIQMDFANWDLPTVERPFGLSSSALTCAEAMWFKLGLADSRAEKHVYLQAGEASGLFIDYFTDV